MTQTAHTPTRPLSDRLVEAATEHLGIDEKFVNFPEYLDPSPGEDGDLYVTDLNNVVRYNVTTGELSTTRDFEEAVHVADHNQHAATTVESIVLG